MEEVEVFTLNAFASVSGGGNPAGVVLNSDELSDEQMLKIAKKVGFSETAFVSSSDKADFTLRFFTPIEEVDLCGHATIAAFYLMANQGLVKDGKYVQETKAGILDIEISKDMIYMDQKRPKYLEFIDKGEISNSLNASTDVLVNDLPVQIVTTGLKDIFVPIRSLRELLNIVPDFSKIKKISKKYGVIGYHAFTLETKNNATAHCRNFAPLYDIDEEAATGTSSGALACYLYKYNTVSEIEEELTFEQGYSMNRPSEIKATIDEKNDEIRRVRVGGRAMDIRKIKVNI